MLGFFSRPIRTTEYFFAQIWNQRIKVSWFKKMAAFAGSVSVRLHKNDYSSHKPSRESILGSWYCQQGL